MKPSAWFIAHIRCDAFCLLEYILELLDCYCFFEVARYLFKLQIVHLYTFDELEVVTQDYVAFLTVIDNKQA